MHFFQDFKIIFEFVKHLDFHLFLNSLNTFLTTGNGTSICLEEARTLSYQYHQLLPLRFLHFSLSSATSWVGRKDGNQANNVNYE